MKQRIARGIARFIVRYPWWVATFLIALTAFSGWRVSKLTINHNQIELIPQDLPSVVATKKMINMVGSVGFLLVPLKGNDLNHTKQVVEQLGERLEKRPEIRSVVYKQDVGFVQDRMALFVETEDLEEGYNRIRKKIRAITSKNNPFAIQLTETKDEPLVLDDLVDKYRRMNNKAVDDPYYVDKAYESILMLVKPSGQSTDQDFLRRLMVVMEEEMAAFNQENTIGAVLKEHYDGMAPGATVTYGYTGTYKRNLDDSENIQQAIAPTSFFAFGGILLYLLYALRRPTQIALIMAVLATAVTISFAFCELVLGELNTVTAILGAILMGLGIDYGIHFMFRFREEYTAKKDLVQAIEQTIEHAGSASIGCSTTTASALYILTLSDFKGFSDFGLVTGTGVLLAFLIMFTAIPTFYVLIDRVWPSFKDSLLWNPKRVVNYDQLRARRYPFAKRILFATAIISAGLVYSATQIRFDYDARSLMAADRPSVVLQEEIGKRWDTSSDPVGIYTETLEEAKALYDHLTPVPEDSNIDTVVSLFTLVPPQEQQEANAKILAKLKRRLEPVDKNLIDDPKIRDNYDRYLTLLDAKPFGLDDLPPHIEQQFRPVEGSDYKGYLTFVYPKTSLWDGEELLAFANEVGEIKVGDNVYHAAGVTVVFAQLAEIVLRDGVIFTILSALAVFLIAWLDFRTVRAAFLTLLPLLSGMVWMLGLMALFDWSINFMNIVVFPLVFGYGISAGVHLHHRYLESDSVMVAVRHTGGAVLAASSTTLVGWASLLVSGHRGLISMGVLACFGIASTLLVSLTVLPALLQITRRKPPESVNPPQAMEEAPQEATG